MLNICHGLWVYSNSEETTLKMLVGGDWRHKSRLSGGVTGIVPHGQWEVLKSPFLNSLSWLLWATQKEFEPGDLLNPPSRLRPYLPVEGYEMGPTEMGAEVGLHVWSGWFLHSLRGPLGHLSPGSVDLSTRDWDSACPLGGWLCQQQRQLQWEGQALHPRKAWALTFFPRVVPPLHNEKKLISTWWQPGCSSCQFPCRDPL